ncbi:MAG: hypothetical protein Q9220_004912 [cf. Caloplaca sp. 1 TL-2023]
MSKSHADERSRILINESPNDVRMKIKAALTDSLPDLTYHPMKRPGVSNLLTLMACTDENKRSEEQIAAECRNLSMHAFKDEVAESIIKGIAGIKAKYDYFIHPAQSHYLQEAAQVGNEKARSKAKENMNQIREIIGLDTI